MNTTFALKVPEIDTVKASWVWLLITFFAGCAGQVAPSGGPVDTVPPSIIRTVPDSNAIRVMPASIEMEFSEYVERRSVEEAVFISPYLGKLEFEWSGTGVTIHWPEQLQKNTTYVVTVGTDVSDVRAGNKMAHAYTLAFSTGDSIDRGVISGRVFDEHPDGIMIFAYGLHGMLPDTLDPTHTRPKYIMQTGKDGTFRLKNIAFDTYRIVAVRDEYRNLVYDREIDQYGVPNGDLDLNEVRPEISAVWFRMSKEDTTRPFLASVTASDMRHLMVRFSEPADTLSFPRAVFSLIDTTSRMPVPISLGYQDMANQALAYLEIVGTLDSTKTYRLRVNGIVDQAGNRLDTNNATGVVSGSPVPDTVKPYPTVRGVADSARGIAPGKVFEVAFTRPLELSSAMRGIVLRDSLSRIVPINVRPRTSTEVFVLPQKPLMPYAWYKLSVVLDSVRDPRGALYHDSVYAVRLQTLDLRTLGSIEGVVADSTGTHAIVVRAKSTNLAPEKEFASHLRGPGKFLMDQVPEGLYGIDAFEDVQGDGHYDAGLPFPFRPGARFAVYPDTVKVRARWSVEGVSLKMR
jgi:hypothetical protein